MNALREATALNQVDKSTAAGFTDEFASYNYNGQGERITAMTRWIV